MSWQTAPLGRRVEKVVTGATYRYIYSGVETVSVYTSTGTWKQDYVYGPGIDEVLMLEQADVLDADGDSNTSETARSWYLKNALGSVMEVLEQDKTEAVSYRYDPYGNLTITRGGSSQNSDPLGQYVTYTGRWHDEETGLYHYRARAYDPARGRFLQRDPLGVTDNQNLFAYVSQRPTNLRDPSGLAGEKPWRGPDQREAPSEPPPATPAPTVVPSNPVPEGSIPNGRTRCGNDPMRHKNKWWGRSMCASVDGKPGCRYGWLQYVHTSLSWLTKDGSPGRGTPTPEGVGEGTKGWVNDIDGGGWYGAESDPASGKGAVGDNPGFRDTGSPSKDAAGMMNSWLNLFSGIPDFLDLAWIHFVQRFRLYLVEFCPNDVGRVVYLWEWHSWIHIDYSDPEHPAITDGGGGDTARGTPVVGTGGKGAPIR